MKNNPIIPYILILAFGIGLIFFMSVVGVGNKEEIATADEAGTTTEGGGETTDGGEVDGAALTQTCIGCHAADFTGSVGPNLTIVDAARIEDVLVNGTGTAGSPMVAGLKTADEAKAIAEYITSLK